MIFLTKKRKNSCYNLSIEGDIMEKEMFMLETEEGVMNCEVIKRIFVRDYQKHYLIYTDHTVDEEGDEKIFISSYQPEDENFLLHDITDEDELNQITLKLEEL